MNTRIQELLKQATSHRTLSSGVKYDFTVDHEKFAELIVRECARVASDYDGAHYVGTAIEKHFGVEE